VKKCLLSWLRATTRAEDLREPSKRTLAFIHRPLFALCEKVDQVLKISSQVLEPLRNLASSKTGAVEAASNYSWVLVFGIIKPLSCLYQHGPQPG
jgi:hypothetical protein